MANNVEINVLKAQIKLLAMLIERECNCDRSRCAEHFRYIERLKFDLTIKLEQYENENKRSN
ncbi:MAG: hypothetical protein LBF04_04085 [Prevotellaceae bacterium]|jgi:hypothetical protein|nr:hypothetical protein [Prevotellaceae bacterium]